MEQKKTVRIVCAGGGTGGHIYPGIAVADALRTAARGQGLEAEIFWLGNARGMDRGIVEKQLVSAGGSITAFYGIPCGKLRRYLSLRNIADAFRILAGFFAALRILKRLRPDCLFSKGGFVSVPPCWASRLLRIPYYTHECDFTPGLATKLNSTAARHILLSYAETARYFPEARRSACVVTGNPVRPVFYEDGAAAGLSFLQVPAAHAKPVLLVMGGSLGAQQINELVTQNLGWFKEHFIVVHQTGQAFAEEHPEFFTAPAADGSYKPYDFIHAQMPSVIQAADIVLSRAGANSLWECAVSGRPLVLIPLSGSGTRGDQVDNARYFAERGAAVSLAGEDATASRLKEALLGLCEPDARARMTRACAGIVGEDRPAQKIAALILAETKEGAEA